ncbi:MAG TPA: 50S ribosomal protein L23 [Halothiobacillus sp.]|nr:50S ribosomal protein L23 [Halothiobacillus sp.]
MRKERLFEVLRAPVVTEKASRVAENNQYVFKVSRDATKADVKAAVEMIFDVKVDDVHVVNMPGKARRFRNIKGKRASWKKAYVTVAEGQTIDFGISA